jgi:hypothetical protein
MSTQRRENRWQRTNCTKRAGAFGQIKSAPIAQKARAYATVGTAPPHTAARLATNSLQSDHRTSQLLGQDYHHGSPPSQAGNRQTGNLQVTPSAHPFSFRLRAHPYRLAAFPGGLSLWTERYDGKRNLYLQHAA